MKKFVSLFVSLFMIITSISVPVFADTEYVTCRNESTNTTYQTLASAIAAANEGDTITMLDDEIVTSAITLDKAITIDGNDNTISAQVTGTDDMLIVNSNSTDINIFVNNSNGALLKNLTIYGGKKSAIYNNKDKRLSIVDCTISRSGTNQTDYTAGGAINNNGGKIALFTSNISQNVADYGAGFLNDNHGIFVLDQCSITENRTVNGSRGGGAVENKGGGKLYFNNCTVANNQSFEIGGAINNNGSNWGYGVDNEGSAIYMSNCTVTGNITTNSMGQCGGGIGNNRGYVYAVNTLCSYNYSNMTGTPTPSDIGIYAVGPASYNSSDYQSDGKTTFFYHCGYESIINGSGNSNAFQEYGDCKITSDTKADTFVALNKFGVLNADGTTNSNYQQVDHPGLVLSSTYTAPIKPNTAVNTKGTETYLHSSDFSNIMLAYKDDDGNIRSLGNSSIVIGDTTYTYTNSQIVDDAVALELTAKHKVTTYQTGKKRASGVIGADGPTTAEFYTIHAQVPNIDGVKPGTVNGVTIYGKTVPKGDLVRLTAKANSGYKFHPNGWDIYSDADYTNSLTQTDVPYEYITSSIVDVPVVEDIFIKLNFEKIVTDDEQDISINFEGIADSGYYSEARDSSSKSGVISYNIYVPEYNSFLNTTNNQDITQIGVAVSIVNPTEINTADTSSNSTVVAVKTPNLFVNGTEAGWYHILVNNIPEANFSTPIYVVPFVTLSNGNTYSWGDSEHNYIVTSVDSEDNKVTDGTDTYIKWLGNEADTNSSEGEQEALVSVLNISFDDIVSIIK